MVDHQQLNRRDQLLRDYRRRLTRLEIETHRLKAALSRLVAVTEDAAADELAAAEFATEPGRSGVAAVSGQPSEMTVSVLNAPEDRSPPIVVDPAHSHAFRLPPRSSAVAAAESIGFDQPETPPDESDVAATPFATEDELPPATDMDRSPDQLPGGDLQLSDNAIHEPETLPLPPAEIIADEIDRQEPMTKAANDSRPLWRRVRDLPAWTVSVAVHVAILVVLALIGFATIQEEKPILAASLAEHVEAAVDELAEVEIEPIDVDEVLDTDTVPLPDFAQLDAPAFESMESLTAVESIGAELDALLAGDVAAGEAGGHGDGESGSSGGGKRGANASFFGASAAGDRFVFIVDNSRSMVEGRMETALFELLRSVSAMKAKQSFYVIFQSDQAYEMYHPDPTSELVPATPQHKAQLQAWLTTIELCYGDAKSLRDAVARAESLEPNAVFLLSDGDFSTFTRDRICATARPEYVLHTLGMTVRDEEDANNLIAIADAHGGTFRPVAVSPAAAEMASRRPIPKNPRGTSWGDGRMGE